MSEKRKLIILKVCGIIFKALLAVLGALEQDSQPEVVDKSVLDQEIPPTSN